MSISYLKDREDMCKVAHYMWDRRLTNAAGGNFAVRVDDDRIPPITSTKRVGKCVIK